jgi:hypothetical protein
MIDDLNATGEGGVVHGGFYINNYPLLVDHQTQPHFMNWRSIHNLTIPVVIKGKGTNVGDMTVDLV